MLEARVADRRCLPMARIVPTTTIYDSEAALADFEKSIASSEEAIGLYPDSSRSQSRRRRCLSQARNCPFGKRASTIKPLPNFERGPWNIAPDDEDFGTEWNSPGMLNNEIAKIELELSEGITWAPCKYGLKCGFVDVPADYRNPDAGSIRIAVSVRRADYQDERIGYLFVNPGGPGGKRPGACRRLRVRIQICVTRPI